MSQYIQLIEELTVSNFFDIVIVAVIIYVIYSQVSRTPALPAIQGFFIIIFITLLSNMFELTTLSYILRNVVSIMLLSVIILFPSEIRNGLYRIGRTGILREALKLEGGSIQAKSIQTLMDVLAYFKRNKIGALIVIENHHLLTDIVKSGVQLNSELQSAVLYSIFQKESPLHDGAVVIRHDKLVAAACYVPNIHSSALGGKEKLGTRHRAALSVTEQYDAFVIVVSEETGQMSVALEGKLHRPVSNKGIKTMITTYFKE